MYLYRVIKSSINKRSNNNNLNNNDDKVIYLISYSYKQSAKMAGCCLNSLVTKRNHLLINEMVIVGVCLYSVES